MPCLTPVIMVLTCYTNIFLQHLLCPALSLWPRRSSPQIICPSQIICYISQLRPMATVDLLSKGDAQKGWEKVTGTSVMDVLKWRTGEYRCLVSDAEPLPVPGLMFVSDNISCFFHLAHAASKTRILFLWMPNVETHMSVDSPQYIIVEFNLFLNSCHQSGWTMEYYHHYAWPEQICTSVWHS